MIIGCYNLDWKNRTCFDWWVHGISYRVIIWVAMHCQTDSNFTGSKIPCMSVLMKAIIYHNLLLSIYNDCESLVMNRWMISEQNPLKVNHKIMLGCSLPCVIFDYVKLCQIIAWWHEPRILSETLAQNCIHNQDTRTVLSTFCITKESQNHWILAYEKTMYKTLILVRYLCQKQISKDFFSLRNILLE